MLRQRSELLELAQQTESERATADPGFKDVTVAQTSEDRLARPCKAAGKDRRELRGRDEVAACAKLLRPTAIVAQPGRIERKLHVAGKIDVASSDCNLIADELN